MTGELTTESEISCAGIGWGSLMFDVCLWIRMGGVGLFLYQFLYWSVLRLFLCISLLGFKPLITKARISLSKQAGSFMRLKINFLNASSLAYFEFGREQKSQSYSGGLRHMGRLHKPV
jgi:hypothetical protein